MTHDTKEIQYLYKTSFMTHTPKEEKRIKRRDYRST